MSIETTAFIVLVIGIILVAWRRRPLTAFIAGLGLGMLIAVEWVNLIMYQVGLYK